MSKIPMMPWFPDTHLSITAFLTLEERGAYRELLDYMWLSGGYLENNDVVIARLLRIPKGRWLIMKPRLEHLFEYEGNKFTHPGLLKIYLETKAKVEKNRKNGVLGAAARQLNQNDRLQATAPANNMHSGGR